MKKSDIEALLHTGEFRHLDFKEAHQLNKSAKIQITKDLIAFSNITDGGLIIIGVNEKKGNNEDPNGEHYEIIGMGPETLATWVRDDLAGVANNYADPYVDFSFEIVPVDKEKSCVVIKVFEFEDCPILCKRDADGLRHGALYTRPKGGKRESCEVRSQTETREILDLAVQKRIKKIISAGTKIGLYPYDHTSMTPDSDKFNKQLEAF